MALFGLRPSRFAKMHPWTPRFIRNLWFRIVCREPYYYSACPNLVWTDAVRVIVPILAEIGVLTAIRKSKGYDYYFALNFLADDEPDFQRSEMTMPEVIWLILHYKQWRASGLRLIAHQGKWKVQELPKKKQNRINDNDQSTFITDIAMLAARAMRQLQTEMVDGSCTREVHIFFTGWSDSSMPFWCRMRYIAVQVVDRLNSGS